MVMMRNVCCFLNLGEGLTRILGILRIWGLQKEGGVGSTAEI